MSDDQSEVARLAEAVAAAVVRTLEQEGYIRKKPVSWDRTAKPDAYYLDIRARTIGLIRKHVAVTYQDTARDPLLRQQVPQSNQWWRVVDNHLANDKPPGLDGLRVTTFVLEGGKAIRYVTRQDWLHCAIVAACSRQRMADPSRVRRYLLEYNAGANCERCHPTTVPAEGGPHE